MFYGKHKAQYDGIPYVYSNVLQFRINSIGRRIFHRKILNKKLVAQYTRTIEQAVNYSKYQITSQYACHIKEIKTRWYFNHIGWIFGTNCHVIFYCVLSYDVVTYNSSIERAHPHHAHIKLIMPQRKENVNIFEPFQKISHFYSIHVPDCRWDENELFVYA